MECGCTENTGGWVLSHNRCIKDIRRYFMDEEFVYQDLKDYKGYGITKVFRVDEDGRKIPGSIVYDVSEGEDFIGEEYKSLAEAKRFIDSLVRSGK